jgi:aminopeptidase N
LGGYEARSMTRTQYWLAISAQFLTLVAMADQPFDFNLAPGRLPKDIVPLDYTIAIEPDIAKSRFSGKESVRLQFASASANVQFDSEDEVLADVRLDGKPVKHVETDNARQLTTVTLSAPAEPGVHELSFSYTGIIRKDPRGLFLQSYAEPGAKQGYLLSTNMEPTDSRFMFPGWDEPAFRATFQLSVTVPTNWTAIGNMPVAQRVVHGSVATITFQRSPKMPTYLVEMTAGDLASISTEAAGTKLGIWAVRGQQQNGATALANAKQILADYNSYFGFRFPLPKLDSIAIPGGFSGGMENWGAITYTDSTLLLTPASSVGDQQEVYSIQAHEMAHQWNGDLVTMGWWDNLWLNESFASFMSARETALRNPGWNWWENQDGDKETALDADASVHSHPIHEAVPDEAHAQVASDSEITYSKGQAVLRMLEAYLGQDKFRTGVQNLMKARAYSNATSADLWNALNRASGRDVAAIAANWTEQPGFPLLSVTAECGPRQERKIRVSQERFLLTGSDPKSSRWNVPIRLRSGIKGQPQSLLLGTDAPAVLAAGRCDEPLSVNADAIGYYRVKYEPAILASDLKAFGQLPMADRIALLDDQWALAKAGREILPTYLKFAGAMGGDLDARAWEQIAAALGSIESDEYWRPGHAAFAAYARRLIKPVADQLGWTARPEETPAVQELRRTLILSLGSWGDPQVIAEAQRRFGEYLKNPKSMIPDDQSMILSIVAQNADAARFAKLHDLARSAKDPATLRRLYYALGEVRDPQLAAQSAAIALSDEIPVQEPNLRFMLLELAARHPQLAWNALRNSQRDLFAQFGPEGAVTAAQLIPQVFWNGASLADLKAWLSAHTPAAMAEQVDHGLERARLRLTQRDRLLPAADRYVQQLR